MSRKILQVNEKDIIAKVGATKKETLVRVSFSSGCMWCTKMKPVFQAYAEKHKEMDFMEWEVGPWGTPPPPVASTLRITSLPSFLLYKNGKFVKFIGKDDLIKEMKWEFVENKTLEDTDMMKLSEGDLRQVHEAAHKRLDAIHREITRRENPPEPAPKQVKRSRSKQKVK